MAIQRRGRGQQKAAHVSHGGNTKPSPSPSSSAHASFSSQLKEVSPNSPFASSRDEPSGVTLSVHPIMPDFGLVQGELFFECTLFLYSVLALFLQYLNLYKSLWWLPKSYWHYSLKMHHINPYFLSCVGLLLGLRVTKCFWNTITVHMRCISENWSKKNQMRAKILEYGVLKLPVTGMIWTSFCFSFSRIVKEFPASSLVYFFFPLLLYMWLFFREIIHRLRKLKTTVLLFFKDKASLKDIMDVLGEEDPGLLDLDHVSHMCSGNAGRIREEVNLLIQDFVLRVKRCLFAGLTTSFLSIGLPLIFVPYRTNLGMPLKILISETWEAEMALIVFCTSFIHYVTYLFPITYLDLLYRSAIHLGRWEELGRDEPSLAPSTLPSSLKRIPHVPPSLPHVPTWSQSDAPYPEGTVVETYDGKRWKAVAISDKVHTVAAMPGHAGQAYFAYWCSHHLSLINGMFVAELVLIFVQSWLLVLTHEWQHIVTLVLLMFTNYILLAKLFKDRVILNRVYEPSKEDLALIEQVREEASRRRETDITRKAE